ncbi:glycerol-3-phosphate acyltransferase [Paratractidigestivibacter sp.]|uniref:glycerol-3-phosphate acyltransferase n=1 Tax=Paratractidigestivibacter sp. TaxID=2847316 RepID=UPI003A904F91
MAEPSMPALIAWTVVFALGAYAVCGVPFGLYIAQALGHVDVRQTGSGNIGTTNVARSVGKKAAALTLLCDLGKGLVWMLFSRFMLSLIVFGQAGFAPELGYATQPGIAMSVIYLGCVFGHVFSPYLDFHGGKGIAVGFGAALGLWWPVALGLLVVFIAFAVPTRYVSLGSVAAAVSLPIQCALWGFPLESVVTIAVVAAVVVWAHRANIRKLVAGEERKFAFHKEGDK